MIQKNEKYNNVLKILRKSKPVLNSTEEIEREVLKRISAVHRSDVVLSDVIDFLFGWVYIGWVRRSLTAASVVLVMVFVYQQRIILNRLDLLSRQTTIIDRETGSIPLNEIETRLAMYKLSARRFSSQNITISEEQMNQLVESLNDLQVKYKDLLKVIEENPELKKFIEKKLIENNRKKTNL